MIEYRGYKIEGDGTFGMKVIKTPIGPLPEMLKGSFTKAVDAEYAIDQYLFIKEERDNRPPPIKKVKLFPREVKVDDAESTGGDQ